MWYYLFMGNKNKTKYGEFKYLEGLAETFSEVGRQARSYIAVVKGASRRLDSDMDDAKKIADLDLELNKI